MQTKTIVLLPIAGVSRGLAHEAKHALLVHRASLDHLGELAIGARTGWIAGPNAVGVLRIDTTKL